MEPLDAAQIEGAVATLRGVIAGEAFAGFCQVEMPVDEVQAFTESYWSARRELPHDLTTRWNAPRTDH